MEHLLIRKLQPYICYWQPEACNIQTVLGSVSVLHSRTEEYTQA